MNNLRTLLLLSLLVFSCGTSQRITGGKIQDYSMETLDQKLQEKTIPFETFYAKSKILISAPTNQNINAIVSLQKDTYIGVSLRFLGVEGAKILITPDSVKILDRLNQKYIPRDFSYLEKMFSIEIDFEMLQNLLLGNLLFDVGTKYPLVADENCNCYQFLVQNGATKNTIQLFPSFDVQSMFVEDLQKQRTLQLQYGNYEKVKNMHFSFLRTIRIDAVEKYAVDMEFTEVTLDQPLDFTFTVSSKYEKVPE